MGIRSRNRSITNGEIYLLDLTAAPAGNRGRAKKAKGWQALGASMKVLKDKLDERIRKANGEGMWGERAFPE
jgi:hypothetical protein